MSLDTPTLQFPFETPPERGEAIEIAQGVLWIRMPMPMALDHVNLYALDDGDGWTLIDAGLNTSLVRGLWTKVLEGPLGGKPVKRVIVTHHHPDHIGLAGWFRETQGAEIWATRTAYLLARMLFLDEQDRPLAETLDFWTKSGMSDEVLAQRKAERPFNFADSLWPLPLGFHRIKQDDVITAGGRRWQVHIGNGHAPEHATLWSLDDNLVLSGDQILSSISPNLGLYATEPEADPVGDWLESCERLSGLARHDHLVLGGHKLPFVGLPMRLTALIENHHSALIRLHKHLETPSKATECFPLLFKRTIGEAEYGLAMVEAVAHCQHLWHEGKATRSIDDKGAWVFAAC